MNANEIKRKLRDRYCVAEGWITMAEVAPPGTNRRFDLLSVMGWKSRGHEAMGFEVKTARGDWLAELAEPKKAEPLASICTRYWIVAPQDVVRQAEMPPAWGLITVAPESLRIAKQAALLKPEEWTADVWRCLLLRCATRERATDDDLRAAEQAGFKRGTEQAKLFSDSKILQRENAALRAAIDEAEKATGVRLRAYVDYPALGEAMKMLKGDHERLADRLSEQAEVLTEAAASMLRAAASMKTETAKGT